MLDMEALLGLAGQEGWAGIERPAGGAPAMMNARLREERSTLSRMWAAVYATPAGKHVIDDLVAGYIDRAHFNPALSGSLEGVAMLGLWSSAQAEIVRIIVGMVADGQQERQLDRSSPVAGASAGPGPFAGTLAGPGAPAAGSEQPGAEPGPAAGPAAGG